MSDTTISWLQELEERYGVGLHFSRRLAPLLDCLAEHSLGDSQRAALFAAIAASYRSTLSDEPRTPQLDEVRMLVAQFITELRKMEESLKVLGTMLHRVREQMAPSTLPRILH